jgi:hypothetical protein
MPSSAAVSRQAAMKALSTKSPPVSGTSAGVSALSMSR